MRRTNRIKLVCAGALALGITLCAFPEATSTIASRTIPASLMPSRQSAELGAKNEYGFAWESSIDTSDGKRLFAVKAQGVLALTAARMMQGEPAYVARLQDLEIRIATGDQSEARIAEAQLRSEQGREFFLLPDSQGRISSILARVGDNATLSTMLRRNIAAALQPLTNPKTTSTSWAVHEQDTTGRLVATYARKSPREITRRIERYLTVGTLEEKPGEQPEVDTSGVTTLVFGSDDLLERLSRNDSMTVDMHSRRITGRTVLSIERKTTGRADTVTVSLAGLSRLPLLMREQAPAEAEVVEGGLAELGPDQQWRALQAEDKNARWDAYEQLKRHFRREPSAMDAFVERLLPGDNEGADAQLALAAIADTKTAEGQRRLLDVVRRADSDLIRQSALQHAAMIEEPTTDTLAELQVLADGGHEDPNTQKSSLLALGAAAGNALRSEDTAASAAGAAALANVVAEFRGADDEEARDLALRALGNSGAPQVLDTLLEELDSSRHGARPAAIDAMRRIDDPRVDDVLLASLNDPDDEMRLTALQTARYRPYTPALERSLLDVLDREESVEGRALAINMIGIHASDSVAVERALHEVVANDSSPDVRKLAQKLLEDAEDIRAHR